MVRNATFRHKVRWISRHVSVTVVSVRSQHRVSGSQLSVRWATLSTLWHPAPALTAMSPTQTAFSVIISTRQHVHHYNWQFCEIKQDQKVYRCDKDVSEFYKPFQTCICVVTSQILQNIPDQYMCCDIPDFTNHSRPVFAVWPTWVSCRDAIASKN